MNGKDHKTARARHASTMNSVNSESQYYTFDHRDANGHLSLLSAGGELSLRHFKNSALRVAEIR